MHFGDTDAPSALLSDVGDDDSDTHHHEGTTVHYLPIGRSNERLALPAPTDAIDLAHRHIGDAGCALLSANLSTLSPRPRALDLDSNGLSGGGAAAAAGGGGGEWG